MINEAKLKQISKTIFGLSRADQTEVLVESGELTTIRFANSFIHQPTSNFENSAKVRLVIGKKVGVASGNQLDLNSLQRLVSQATEICCFQKDDPGFKSLPGPHSLRKIKQFDQKTAKITSKELAQKVKVVINRAKEENLVASGSLTRFLGGMAVANSLGVWAYQTNTQFSFSTVVMGQSGSGYASALGWRLDQIDEKAVAEKAVQKALSSQKPINLKPGEYEVILESAAFEEIMDYFAWLGPNARVYHEGASYFKGRLGKKVFSSKLNIIDDPFDPRGLPASFDYEGQPKQKLAIVRNGVIKNIAYDSYYAQKYKKTNTGHALPAPNTLGPLVSHLVIKPGQASLDQMISKVKRGLLVTRLWYIRSVHFGEMLLTGMTRDGLFLIEGGQIKAPVKNLRFTESIPRIFKNILEIGNDLSVYPSWGGGANLAPSVKVANFRFTS